MHYNYLNHFTVLHILIHKEELFAREIATCRDQTIIPSLKDDLNFETNSPAALKHFSASTEKGGSEFRQDFMIAKTTGHSLVAS